MIVRLRGWVHAWLVAFDALVCVTISGPTDPSPSPYETISSRCGRAANAGMRWGIIAQRWIDRLFEALGSPTGHCQRAIIRADWLDAPLT